MPTTLPPPPPHSSTPTFQEDLPNFPSPREIIKIHFPHPLHRFKKGVRTMYRYKISGEKKTTDIKNEQNYQLWQFLVYWCLSMTSHSLDCFMLHYLQYFHISHQLLTVQFNNWWVTLKWRFRYPYDEIYQQGKDFTIFTLAFLWW